MHLSKTRFGKLPPEVAVFNILTDPDIDYIQVDEFCRDPYFKSQCTDSFYSNKIKSMYPMLPSNPIGMTAKEYFLLVYSIHNVTYGSENYLNMQVCLDRAVRKGDQRLVEYFVKVSLAYNYDVYADSRVAGYYLTKDKLPDIEKDIIAAVEGGILKYKDVIITPGPSIIYTVTADGYDSKRGYRDDIIIALVCGGGIDQARAFQEDFPPVIDKRFDESRPPLYAKFKHTIYSEETTIAYALALRGDYDGYVDMFTSLSATLIPHGKIMDQVRNYITPVDLRVIDYILNMVKNNAATWVNTITVLIGGLNNYKSYHRQIDPIYAKKSEAVFNRLTRPYNTPLKVYSSTIIALGVVRPYNTPLAAYSSTVPRSVGQSYVDRILDNVNNPIILARAIVEKGMSTYEDILQHVSPTSPHMIVFKDWLTGLVEQSSKPLKLLATIPFEYSYSINGEEYKTGYISGGDTIQDLIELEVRPNQEIVALIDKEQVHRTTLLEPGMKIDLIVESVLSVTDYTYKPASEVTIGDYVLFLYNDVPSLGEFVDNTIVHYTNKDIVVDGILAVLIRE